MMKLVKLPSVILSEAVRRSRRISLVFVIILSACTDYVSQIEDERDEWRSAREQAALLSSGEVEEESSSSSSVILSSENHDNSTSSSAEPSSSSVKSNGSSSSVILSGDSREESSSSTVKSCSSEKTAASSSSKDPEPAERSSSSLEDVVSSSSSKKDVISSSSEKVASSSSGKASWAYLNSVISYGEMTDDRDGQVYKTVVIGEQTWMAENLNLEIGASLCYECDVYGRLYTWSLAMDSAGIYSGDGKGCTSSLEKSCTPSYPVRGICPENWHLPDSNELSVLKEATTQGDLKSKNGWYVDAKTNSNGQDNYGFSGVPVGYWYSPTNTYGHKSNLAAFWSSSENVSVQNRYNAYAMLLAQNNVNSTSIGGSPKTYGYSVRCLKNEFPKSSSSISSSSSSKASWAYLNPAISYGEITDDRDGQVYKTVEIGEQTWMAENLNYEIEPYKINYEEVRSFCYNDSVKYCEKYGRLYTWQAAKRACPTNWRLPTNAEFHALVDAAGGMSIAGKKLRAFGANSGCEGTNDYGFSGFPSGMWDDYDGYYAGEGTSAYFWSSTEFNTDFDLRGAYYMMLWDANNYVYLDNTGDPNRRDFYTNYGYSVRCIKKD